MALQGLMLFAVMWKWRGFSVISVAVGSIGQGACYPEYIATVEKLNPRSATAAARPRRTLFEGFAGRAVQDQQLLD